MSATAAPDPSPQDRAEFESMLATADAFTVRDKRAMFTVMRTGATLNRLLPKHGMTIGEVNTMLIIREKSSNKSDNTNDITTDTL